MARHERRVGYGLPTLLAIGVHVLVLLLTVLRWPDSEATPSSSSVVQATLVSTETATDKAQRVEEAKASAAQARQAEDAAEAAREAERAEAEAARQQAEAEAQAANEAERAEAEAARQQAEAQAQRRAEEAARQAELRKQRAEQQRQEQAREEAAEAKRQAEEEARKKAEAAEEAKRQAEEEARRKAEAAAEAKRQAEEEARRKAEAAKEAERQRQEELKRAAEAAASSLDNLIAGEAQSIANAKQAAQASNSFINLVRNAVEQAWILPSGSNGQLEALVRIQLLPTGELISASISKSSGDATFDRSVLLAVERAAPFREMSELPASAQSQFREFNLDFNPEDVRR